MHDDGPLSSSLVPSRSTSRSLKTPLSLVLSLTRPLSARAFSSLCHLTTPFAFRCCSRGSARDRDASTLAEIPQGRNTGQEHGIPRLLFSPSYTCFSILGRVRTLARPPARSLIHQALFNVSPLKWRTPTAETDKAGQLNALLTRPVCNRSLFHRFASSDGERKWPKELTYTGGRERPAPLRGPS